MLVFELAVQRHNRYRHEQVSNDKLEMVTKIVITCRARAETAIAPGAQNGHPKNYPTELIIGQNLQVVIQIPVYLVLRLLMKFSNLLILIETFLNSLTVHI